MKAMDRCGCRLRPDLESSRVGIRGNERRFLLASFRPHEFQQRWWKVAVNGDHPASHIQCSDRKAGEAL